MAQRISIKPFAFALGAAFATNLASSGIANAADNPFAVTELSSGYQVAESAEGKCGEGKCGAQGKAKKDAEGKCGGAKDEAKSDSEAKSGEGKCGEGKCGGDK